MRVLPILFNTEMVKAILDGRKTVTRRLVRKNDIEKLLNSPFHEQHPEVTDIQIINKLCTPPYQTGDIMYVRETWGKIKNGTEEKYVYRADGRYPSLGDGCFMNFKWHPSLHMPGEAARIFLMVKSVRVERLQDINGRDVLKEGLNSLVHPDAFYFDMNQREMFERLWNSTIKKTELEQFGWDANPYVWVIEFERCEKPEGV